MVYKAKSVSERYDREYQSSRLKTVPKKRARFNVVTSFIIAVLVLGMILGCYLGYIDSKTNFTGNNHSLDSLINSYKETTASRTSIFFNRILDYGKYALIIWLLGFALIGAVFSLAVSFVKGAGLGYTAAFIFLSQVKGMYYAVFFLSPQLFVILPMIVYICGHSIRQSVLSRTTRETNIMEYGFILAKAAGLVFIAALFEAFVMYNLIGGLS